MVIILQIFHIVNTVSYENTKMNILGEVLSVTNGTVAFLVQSLFFAVL